MLAGLLMLGSKGASAKASVVPSRFHTALPFVADKGTLTAVKEADQGPGTLAAVQTGQFNQDDQLVLEVAIAGKEDRLTVIAYAHGDSLWLPLGNLSRWLDLAINVQADGRKAAGWVLRENRTLSIDVAEAKVLLAGKPLVVAETALAVSDGDLYVSTSLLQKILPLIIGFQMASQMVSLTPTERFPFQEMQDRARERATRQRVSSIDPRTSWPLLASGYRAAEFPLIDVSLHVGTNAGGQADNGYTMQSAGDLLWMGTRFYLSGGSRGAINSARIEFGRSDSSGGLLGPLQATQFAIGDVATVGMGIGLRGASGRGAWITNAPVGRLEAFQLTEFHGNIDPQWEVNLYRNNVLLGSAVTPSDGRYSFPDVAVNYGLNIFRLVFFGPQGQRREEVRQINVGLDQSAPGKLIYHMAAAQDGTGVIDLPYSAMTATLQRGWVATAQLQYGLTTRTSLDAAFGFAQASAYYRESRQLVSLGVRSSFGDQAVRLMAATQNFSGSALAGGVDGQWLGTTYQLFHARYFGGFLDEVRSLGLGALSSASLARVSAAIHMGQKRVPIDLTLRDLRTVDAGANRSVEVRSTLNVLQTILALSTRYSQSSGQQILQTGADLMTIGVRSPLSMHVHIDGSILPHPQIQNLAFDLARKFGPNLRAQVSVTQGFAPRQTALGLSVAYSGRWWDSSLDVVWRSQQKSLAVMLRLGFSILRNPATGAFSLHHAGLSNQGAVQLHAFYDKNDDGAFSDGDTPVPGVSFRRAGPAVVSDANGFAWVTGLTPQTTNAIAVDPDSLPDIDDAPVSAGLRVVARAGHIERLEVPIRRSYRVAGHVKIMQGAKMQPIGGVELIIVTPDGRELARTRSEGDGFFEFAGLSQGEGLLSVSPEQQERYHFKLLGNLRISVGPSQRQAGDHSVVIEIDDRVKPLAGEMSK